MTVTTEPVALDHPRITAVTRPDATGEVIIDGVTRPVSAHNAAGLRRVVTELLAQTAQTVGRPVKATTTGPEGTWHLIVHPDLRVESDPNPPRQHGYTPVPASDPAAENVHAYASTLPGPTAGDLALAPPPSGDILSGTVTPARRSFVAPNQREAPAKRGLRGTANRFLGLRTAPTGLERAERAAERAVGQHFAGGRTIAVVNGKGGASKTPSTVCLAAVFARYGGAGVAAWDNNQTRGTLGWRTEQGPHNATLLDLLPTADQLMGPDAQAGDISQYMHHQITDRFDVLRSQPMKIKDEQRLVPDDYDVLHRVLRKYYRLVFVDSGNDESDPLWRRMIEQADQIVVASTERDDIAEAGALLLEALAQRDEHSARLARNAVVVVNHADLKAPTDKVQDVADGLRSMARETVTIPYDQAMVSGHLAYENLRPATRRAWLAAGAAVADSLTQQVQQPTYA